jgi:hypothetical protein
MHTDWKRVLPRGARGWRGECRGLEVTSRRTGRWTPRYGGSTASTVKHRADIRRRPIRNHDTPIGHHSRRYATVPKIATRRLPGMTGPRQPRQSTTFHSMSHRRRTITRLFPHIIPHLLLRITHQRFMQMFRTKNHRHHTLRRRHPFNVGSGKSKDSHLGRYRGRTCARKENVGLALSTPNALGTMMSGGIVRAGGRGGRQRAVRR